jgi:hypothetical protein
LALFGAAVPLGCGTSGSNGASDAATADATTLDAFATSNDATTAHETSAPDTAGSEGASDGAEAATPSDGATDDAVASGEVGDAGDSGSMVLEGGCIAYSPIPAGSGVVCFNSDTPAVTLCGPGEQCVGGTCSDAAPLPAACKGPCCGIPTLSEGCAQLVIDRDAAIGCPVPADAGDEAGLDISCYCYKVGGGPLFPPDLPSLC